MTNESGFDSLFVGSLEGGRKYCPRFLLSGFYSFPQFLKCRNILQTHFPFCPHRSDHRLHFA